MCKFTWVMAICAALLSASESKANYFSATYIVDGSYADSYFAANNYPLATLYINISYSITWLPLPPTPTDNNYYTNYYTYFSASPGSRSSDSITNFPYYSPPGYCYYFCPPLFASVMDQNREFSLTASGEFASLDFSFSVPVTAIPEPVAAIPESSTWAMLLIGFAGIGFLAYRRCSPLPKVLFVLTALFLIELLPQRADASVSFDSWTIGFNSSDNHFDSGPTIPLSSSSIAIAGGRERLRAGQAIQHQPDQNTDVCLVGFVECRPEGVRRVEQLAEVWNEFPALRRELAVALFGLFGRKVDDGQPILELAVLL
jgi:hypothetical protein